MSNCRCATCGRTNDKRVAQFAETYYAGPYHRDPRKKLPWDMICDECYMSIRNTVKEFHDEQPAG